MKISKSIDFSKKLSPKQLEMLQIMDASPVVPDEDCPEFSEAELMQFKRISSDRQSARNKQTVTLRLSPQALQKAKSLGKGYTSVLSRILESALENPEIVKHNL
ncbi:MAG: BrnA antitoxin family protein [Oscillospiraceae bacterium]